jgi:hypothetical protein
LVIAARGEIRRREVSQRAMRTLLVIFDSPLLQNDSGFQRGVEDLLVQAFIAQLVVEVVELRPIIAAQVLGRALMSDRFFQHRDRINGPG